MTLDAATYFEHLKAYLNDEYIVHDGTGGELILTEKYFSQDSPKAKYRNIRLGLAERGLAFKLDQDVFGKLKKPTVKDKPALFHFLDDTAKPWSKRCDFVVFRTQGRSLHADCIEFKSGSLNVPNITAQLTAGVSWCRSLKDTIGHYTGYRRKMRIRKFVFAEHENANAYLSPNRQLLADPSIRYLHFQEAHGQPLADLPNASIQEI